MLKIRAAAVTDLDSLRYALQRAIELEHATLPPYLTALYSLKPGRNREIAEVIHSVVMEEMLHMTLAANILNAVGGCPAINRPGFIPRFPGPLPMGIGDEGSEVFIVPIRAFSKPLVHDVFMAIEEPQEPIDFPRAELAATEAAAEPEPEHYDTIGAFYEAIKRRIYALGESIFTGDPSRQVTGWLPDMIAIDSVEIAVAAIDTIVSQGEGSETSPRDLDGRLAHYYRFAEIYYGRRLVRDEAAEKGYSYTGAPLPFDPAGVWPMIDDPHAGDYRPGSTAERLANQFNYTYGSLLNALHLAFNGQPERLKDSVGIMYSLRLQAEKLMATYVSDAGTAGPTWEYVRLNL